MVENPSQQLPEIVARPAEPRYSAREPLPVQAPARIDDGPAGPPKVPDIAAAANLCTELARVIEPDEVQPLLQRLADLLGASGVVVWLSDRTGQKLTPAMTYGYPESVIARIANVQRTAQNATAAAFRSAQPEIVTGTGTGNGAIAIPLVTPDGCAGVLAAEIRHGGEQSEWVPAFARIFAAQLAMLIAPPSAEAQRAHA
jgi:GAF domain-containing protein